MTSDPRVCDEAQGTLSALSDGELDAGDPAVMRAVDHRDSCADCRRFADHLERAHRYLQTTSAPATRDIASGVLAQIRREAYTAPEAPVPRSPVAPAGATGGRRRRPLSAAAVFVAAAVAAALLVHTSTDGPDVAAADLAERVIAAQHDVTSLSAHVTIIERGWNPAVPERRFEGALTYAAPEQLRLSLQDHTTYPDASWRPNDLDLAVDEDTWAVNGLRDCPSGSQPDCTPVAPDDRAVTGREPFSTATPAPLDLIMPVQSFALAGAAATLPDQVVGGRPTVGIETTAAQVGPLLDGLRPTGNLRRVHPADPVQLRLDRETLVPLRIMVLAGAGGDRRSWADTRGYVDHPGTTIVDVTLTDVVVNGELNGQGPADATPSTEPAPPLTGAIDAGFRDGAAGNAEAPRPRRLPAGLQPYRSGLTDTAEGPAVTTRTWTDGRAWLAVSASDEWPGGRLMGDLGATVRRLDLGAGSTGYLSEDGERVGIHTDGLDVVVAGSVSRAELVEAASTLGLVGEAVPRDWDEAATATVAEARSALDPLLLPHDLDGFGPPALRVDGAAVTAAFAGAGDRSFVLEQSIVPKLPPLAADGVVAVTVRGIPGRYVVDRGELEWFEGNNLYRLRSLSLSRDELSAIADDLRPA